MPTLLVVLSSLRILHRTTVSVSVTNFSIPFSDYFFKFNNLSNNILKDIILYQSFNLIKQSKFKFNLGNIFLLKDGNMKYKEFTVLTYDNFITIQCLQYMSPTLRHQNFQTFIHDNNVCLVSYTNIF